MVSNAVAAIADGHGLTQGKANASDLLQQKADLEKQKRAMEDSAILKQLALDKKLKTIGNYVHDSVPVSNTEVHHS